MDKKHDLKEENKITFTVAKVNLFAYVMVNLQRKKQCIAHQKKKYVCHEYLILHMLKCKKGSQVTQPCSLAVEMPCPPVIDNGEVQRSYPRLRTELRHLEIMVSAALMQTQGVGYKVWEKQLTYQLL